MSDQLQCASYRALKHVVIARSKFHCKIIFCWNVECVVLFCFMRTRDQAIRDQAIGMILRRHNTRM